jgi:high affinity sulfate transporter 1
VHEPDRHGLLTRRFGSAPRRDALAGLTVAAYLVPQVVAYAGVAGLPPVTGLWAAAASLAGYALAGSSRQLSVGPESATALMTAVAVAPLAAAHPERAPVLAAGLAVLVGVVCLLGRLARLGFLADLLSRPVLVGYLAGIAGIMIVSQLGNVTGVPVPGGGPGAELIGVATNLHRVHVPTLVLATSVLAFLLAVGHRWPRLPGPLIAVLLAAGVTSALGTDLAGIRTVGAVPTGLPLPTWPAVTPAEAAALVFPAVGVAMVGYVDTVLTGRAFVTRRGEHLDADREMFALGVVNVASGLVSGFPVSSSGSRTAIADATGARSQLHSVASLVVVLAVLVVGGPVLAALPSAALGALVVYAAARLVRPAEFRRIARFRRTELLLAVSTTVAVLVLGVLTGVLVAIALSILDLLRRVSRPHDGVLGYVPGLAGMHDIDDYPDSTVVPGLVVYRYDAPLCFANAEDFRRRVLIALDRAPTPTRWLVLNMEAVIEIDLTASDMLNELAAELDRRGVTLALARVKQDLRADLRPAGLLDRIGPDRIFPTLPTAVEAYHEAAGEA